MRAKVTIQRGTDPATSEDEGLLDEEVLQLLRERQNTLTAMKAALLRGDDRGALVRARALTGIATEGPSGFVEKPATPAPAAAQMDPREDAPELRLNVTQGLLDVVMDIGRERAKIEMAMRAALLRGDERDALERARELTGLAG